MTISNLEEKTYPTVIVANAAQRIMADQVIAWYGPENIERIVPSNELFVEAHFKDGSVKMFFCGMYMPELMKKDEDREHDKRMRAYYRRFFLYDADDKRQPEEQDVLKEEEKEEEEQIEEPEMERYRSRSRR